MSAVLKILGIFVPLDSNLALFVSFMGSKFNDSPKAIYDYMQTRLDFQKYHCVWAFENSEKFPDVESVKIDTPKYFIIALKAKYWVTNTNINRGITFKKKDWIFKILTFSIS